ncbi:hypothetical protein H2200_009454 [Cladophialophora chaetospira]|uniref:N-acetyltransferase domain-containing protein n=1 Tax=Cladophialophora chaetospira TaxID=386627 RepID=A0AA38X4F4_9EURO|nr:hypothetical protein H2200_009454 [Cladophialophora chaetospira]
MFDDELTDFLAPHRHQHPECLRLGFLRRAKKRFYDGHLVLAAVSDEKDPWWDGREKVVGYLSATSTQRTKSHEKTSWFSWNALELRLLRLEELIEWYTFADRSISRSAWLQYFNSVSERGPLADVQEYWDIDHLSVDPAHHGKGIGKALVKHVQELASKDALPIVLVASKQGYPMYKKLGFVDKGAFNMGAGQVNEAMIWYPPNTQEPLEAAKGDESPDEVRNL